MHLNVVAAWAVVAVFGATAGEVWVAGDERSEPPETALLLASAMHLNVVAAWAVVAVFRATAGALWVAGDEPPETCRTLGPLALAASVPIKKIVVDGTRDSTLQFVPANRSTLGDDRSTEPNTMLAASGERPQWLPDKAQVDWFDSFVAPPKGFCATFLVLGPDI